MSTLADMTSWPAALPLPFVDYDGEPMHVTLASKLENPKIQRRRRFQASVISVAVRWVFNVAEYAEFKAFFLDTLGNGGAQFLLELKYPRTSTLTTWKAKFTSSYRSTNQLGHWEVEGELELMDGSLAAAGVSPEPLLDWVNFYVVPLETPFATADDFLYCVHV